MGRAKIQWAQPGGRHVEYTKPGTVPDFSQTEPTAARSIGGGGSLQQQQAALRRRALEKKKRDEAVMRRRRSEDRQGEAAAREQRQARADGQLLDGGGERPLPAGADDKVSGGYYVQLKHEQGKRARLQLELGAAEELVAEEVLVVLVVVLALVLVVVVVVALVLLVLLEVVLMMMLLLLLMLVMTHQGYHARALELRCTVRFHKDPCCDCLSK